MSQYTIRNVPEALDRELRERAKRKGISLNDVVYDDLDDLIGTWKHDDEFDSAIKEQDKVDADAWQ